MENRSKRTNTDVVLVFVELFEALMEVTRTALNTTMSIVKIGDMIQRYRKF